MSGAPAGPVRAPAAKRPLWPWIAGAAGGVTALVFAWALIQRSEEPPARPGVESAFSPGLQTPTAGSLVEDAVREVVFSPPIPHWRAREKAKWEISAE